MRAIVILILMWGGTCFAQISPPGPVFLYGGWYRPGRVMPVTVGPEPMTLTADGAVPTIKAAGAGNQLIPWMPLAPLRNAVAGMPGGDVALDERLHPLGENDRLVIASSADVASLQALWPGMQIIPLQQAFQMPSRDDVWKWETLDAIVLDETGLAMLERGGLFSRVLGMGVTLAVRSPAAPDHGYAWEKVGELWVCRPEIVGPRGVIVPAAYQPVQNWRPGASGGLRVQALLAAILFCILALSVTLWRPRRTGLVAGGLVVLFCGGAWVWMNQQPRTALQGGSIVVDGDSVRQQDTWLYETARLPDTARWDLSDRPVLASLRHAETLDLRIEATDAGAQWVAELQPGLVVARLGRSIEEPGAAPLATSTARSPMMGVARGLYLRPGLEIAGEFSPTSPVLWDTLVIQDRSPE